MDKIEKFLLEQYEFKRNSVLDRTEFRKKGSEFFKLLTERDLNSIMRHLENEEKRCTRSKLIMILNSDFVPESDPFIDYFKNLPPWEDGVDYIGSLAATIQTTTQDLWYEYFRKWLVATVACAVNPNVVNHQVLVLVGPQGKGKTSWLNKLLPEELDGYLYSGLIDPNNKDTLVQLAENFLINLDELENLNKTELGSLKSLITQSAIKLRKAYAVFNENIRRRASFMGSVNDAEFLNDTTGNRRYLCFTCDSINYQHKVDLRKVYAQAYALYKSGTFKFYFDFEDSQKIEEINKQYLRVGTEEDLLLKYFVPGERGGDNTLILTPVEILNMIEQLEKRRVFDNHTSVRRIGQALQKHGFKKISKDNRKPYLLKRVIRDDDDSISSVLKDTSEQIFVEVEPIENSFTTPPSDNRFVNVGDFDEMKAKFDSSYNGEQFELNTGAWIEQDGWYQAIIIFILGTGGNATYSFIFKLQGEVVELSASKLTYAPLDSVSVEEQNFVENVVIAHIWSRQQKNSQQNYLMDLILTPTDSRIKKVLIKARALKLVE